MVDVVVVGGGPGGLYSAWSLARRGLQVALVEEHEAAGQPVHCTGIIAPEAFQQFNLPRNTVLNELSTFHFFSPSGQIVRYTPPSVEAVVIDRVQFDQELYRMAKDAGVEMHMGRRITSIETSATQVRLQCGDKILLGRACILATGANYTLHRQLELELPPLYLNSAQIEVPVQNDGDVEVYFGSQIASKGFAWVVPVKRGSSKFARIGLMCSSNADEPFSRVLQAVSSRWGLDAYEDIKPRKRMLPLAPIKRTSGRRLLVVGDAAGLVKPTTGGGIYFSIVAAAIAAEVLEGALLRDDLSKASLSEYEVRWRRELGSELRSQILMRCASERLEDADIEELFGLARTNGLMSLIRDTAHFNRHHDLIRVLFRYPATRKILLRRVLAATGLVSRNIPDEARSF